MDEIIKKEIHSRLKENFKKNKAKIPYLLKSISDFEARKIDELAEEMDDFVDEICNFDKEK
tara:strand:- start:681 stop:863 length:183 start_codon:yes stop_codon:yes gene_type:complete